MTNDDYSPEVARIAEVTLGLGVTPDPDCHLCDGREHACPIHAGVAIAQALAAEGRRPSAGDECPECRAEIAAEGGVAWCDNCGATWVRGNHGVEVSWTQQAVGCRCGAPGLDDEDALTEHLRAAALLEAATSLDRVASTQGYLPKDFVLRRRITPPEATD